MSYIFLCMKTWMANQVKMSDAKVKQLLENLKKNVKDWRCQTEADTLQTCFVQVKINVLQVLVWTNLALKVNCQQHSKFVGAQNLENIDSQYKIKNIPGFIHISAKFPCFVQVFTSVSDQDQSVRQ